MNDDFKGKKFLRRDTMALIERRGSAVRRSSVAATRDSSFSTSSSGRGSLAGQWYLDTLQTLEKNIVNFDILFKP